MRTVNQLKWVLLLFCFLWGGGLMAQDQAVEIKGKRTLFVPKLDLLWAGVVIAEGFPTFFPLEFELNFPNPRVSLTAIVSPWANSYNASQTTFVKERSIIGGFGLRYYAFLTEGAGAQGIFIEPQVFYRWHRLTYNYPQEWSVTTTDRAFMGAVGYQRAFFERLYVQARVSVGYTDTAILSGVRKDNLLFLPWLGVGVGF